MSATSNVSRATMKIEANSVMFELLSSGLYSDKPMAVLRELSTNAVDATIAGGRLGTPCLVHLPTRLDPVLKIRDYGTGMSRDTVYSLYSTMGASSKRESNEFTGCLGVGSKSPFSYTAGSAFTVTSFYNKRKTIYSVFADEGIPSIAELGGFDTDEANGIEVSVPVKVEDIGKFTSSAEKLYRHFPVKPKLNVELNLELGDILYQGTNWKIYNNSNSPVVIMANVAYPIDFQQVRNLSVLTTQGLVIEAPTGSIQFAASRESLSYTDSTIKELTNYNAIVEREITKEIERVVSKYDKNLIELSKALRGLPQTIRRIFAAQHNIKYLDRYTTFEIVHPEFKFKYINNYNDRFNNVNSISSAMLEKCEIIMADNVRAAESISQHLKTQNKTALLVLHKHGKAYYESNAEATKAFKEFLDVIGKPYLISSEESIKLFGTTTKVSKGAVATNLSYRASGFTWEPTRPHASYIRHNSHLVTSGNKGHTIGIPISSRDLCDVNYNKVGTGTIDSLRELLKHLRPTKQLTFVTIPKTHKEHLTNTTDIFTYLKSIVPKRIVCVSNETLNYFSGKEYPMSLNNPYLPKEFSEHLEYIRELHNVTPKFTADKVARLAEEFCIKVELVETEIAEQHKVLHNKYKPLSICRGYEDANIDSLVYLANLIYKETSNA
jgi:hypothetical protein